MNKIQDVVDAVDQILLTFMSTGVPDTDDMETLWAVTNELCSEHDLESVGPEVWPFNHEEDEDA